MTAPRLCRQCRVQEVNPENDSGLCDDCGPLLELPRWANDTDHSAEDVVSRMRKSRAGIRIAEGFALLDDES